MCILLKRRYRGRKEKREERREKREGRREWRVRRREQGIESCLPAGRCEVGSLLPSAIPDG